MVEKTVFVRDTNLHDATSEVRKYYSENEYEILFMSVLATKETVKSLDARLAAAPASKRRKRQQRQGESFTVRFSEIR